MAITIAKKLTLTNLKKIKSKSNRDLAKNEIAEYLEDKILDYVGHGKSPVSGQGEFKSLNSKYIKVKKKISGSGKPNLELYGDMLDDFEVRVNGNEISVGFFKDSATESSLLKAERHNHWTKRATTIGNGKSFPKRQFIPKGDQKFNKEIMDDIESIIKDHMDSDAN